MMAFVRSAGGTAAGTLLVIDWSLPGGFIEGVGSIRHAQTMAFTTLFFFSIFTVFTVRSDFRSVFGGLFQNRWLWGAVLSSMALQVAVVYVPFLQKAFGAAGLGLGDWLRAAMVASSILWLSELTKLVIRVAANRQML